MGDPKKENFDSTVQKTKEWTKDVMEALGTDNERQAVAALRAVLHALRDRLIVEESADFAAQLPMLLRGLYFEGWRPADVPEKIRHREDFYNRVGEYLYGHDEMDAQTATGAVLEVISKRIEKGEIEDIKSNFTRQVKELFPEP